ncbi:MAG: ATP-binding protein [Campylobacterota bacterium]|nr:ATP-binding protein [Campylobacterota bacterium]
MFKTGNPVTGKDFIDRKKHLPLFQTYIDQNQSFMIKAPRRFGKTSIIKHLLEDKKEYEFVYIDIKIASTLKSLAEKIINSAYKISAIDNFLYKVKNSMFDLIKSIQKVKLDDIAQVTIKMCEKDDIDEVEYFLHSLDLLNTIAKKKDINIKFALDEFQDILKIASKDILDKSRSVMQHHNNITYIFLGSIESIMTQIFEQKSSAFFHFATIVELPPLDVDELYRYSKKVFEEKGIKCDGLKYLLEYLGGHPDYSLQVLQKLYFIALANDIKELIVQNLYDTLIDVILSNKAYIDELISKAKQKKHSLDVLYNIANNQKQTLESKTLYNVHSSLEDMGLIRKVAIGKYTINDMFLKIILQQKEDEIRLVDF